MGLETWFLVTVLLLTLVVPLSCAAPGGPPPQPVWGSNDATVEASLIALYLGSGGAGWTNNTGWAGSDSYCHWFGVHCYRNAAGSTLMNLNMILNGLSGTIASEIGSLNSNSNNIYLDTLSLSANPVSGTLPSEVESLSSMRGFLVGGSEMLISGTIPTSWGSLTSMELLVYENTKSSWYGSPETRQGRISGTVPSEIASLTSLKYWWGGGQSLSGSVASALTAMTSLEYIVLPDNPNLNMDLSALLNITSIKVIALRKIGTLGKLPPNMTSPNLVVMSIGLNSVDGTLPGHIESPKLERLDLSGNRISGTLTWVDHSLQNLTQIMLHNNKISGTLMRSAPANLLTATFTRNYMQGDTRGLNDAVSLRTLLLSANRFECEAVSGDNSPKLGQGVFYTLSADVLRLFLVDISRWMQKIDFPIERYDTVQQDINAELDCAVFVFAGNPHMTAASSFFDQPSNAMKHDTLRKGRAELFSGHSESKTFGWVMLPSGILLVAFAVTVALRYDETDDQRSSLSFFTHNMTTSASTLPQYMRDARDTGQKLLRSTIDCTKTSHDFDDDTNHLDDMQRMQEQQRQQLLVCPLIRYLEEIWAASCIFSIQGFLLLALNMVYQSSRVCNTDPILVTTVAFVTNPPDVNYQWLWTILAACQFVTLMKYDRASYRRRVHAKYLYSKLNNVSDMLDADRRNLKTHLQIWLDNYHAFLLYNTNNGFLLSDNAISKESAQEILDRVEQRKREDKAGTNYSLTTDNQSLSRNLDERHGQFNMIVRRVLHRVLEACLMLLGAIPVFLQIAGLHNGGTLFSFIFTNSLVIALLQTVILYSVCPKVIEHLVKFRFPVANSHRWAIPLITSKTQTLLTTTMTTIVYAPVAAYVVFDDTCFRYYLWFQSDTWDLFETWGLGDVGISAYREGFCIPQILYKQTFVWLTIAGLTAGYTSAIWLLKDLPNEVWPKWIINLFSLKSNIQDRVSNTIEKVGSPIGTTQAEQDAKAAKKQLKDVAKNARELAVKLRTMGHDKFADRLQKVAMQARQAGDHAKAGDPELAALVERVTLRCLRVSRQLRDDALTEEADELDLLEVKLEDLEDTEEEEWAELQEETKTLQLRIVSVESVITLCATAGLWNPLTLIFLPAVVHLLLCARVWSQAQQGARKADVSFGHKLAQGLLVHTNSATRHTRYVRAGTTWMFVIFMFFDYQFEWGPIVFYALWCGTGVVLLEVGVILSKENEFVNMIPVSSILSRVSSRHHMDLDTADLGSFENPQTHKHDEELCEIFDDSEPTRQSTRSPDKYEEDNTELHQIFAGFEAELETQVADEPVHFALSEPEDAPPEVMEDAPPEAMEEALSEAMEELEQAATVQASSSESKTAPENSSFMLHQTRSMNTTGPLSSPPPPGWRVPINTRSSQSVSQLSFLDDETSTPRGGNGCLGGKHVGEEGKPSEILRTSTVREPPRPPPFQTTTRTSGNSAAAALDTYVGR